MLRLFTHAFLVLFLATVSVGTPSVGFCQQQPGPYSLPPEASRAESVPEGKVLGPFEFASQVYPGTERQYWVYVPSQYDANKPACVLVVQDGIQRANEWHLPAIMDNLIHTKEMPVTIGVFVTPGVVPSTLPHGQARFNRSFEYDSLGDRYARFLIEELLPEAGKTYALSNDPNDRCLAGASSGGICAFNAAWERPDAFRRVISTIGTYVGLRGGNQFPMLVRKTEPKPLRVFLQDGSHDLNIYGGDWWIANQDMLSALRYAGYDVESAWGDGGHDGKHASSIMPKILRWIWKDYPEPIKTAPNPTEPRRMEILVPNQDWELVSSGHESVEAPTCNSSGEIFFCDSKAGRIYRSGLDGKTRVFAEQTGRVTGMSFGPDGKLYVCQASRKRIVRYADNGVEEVVLGDTPCQEIATLPTGFFYTDPSTPAIWWSDYAGKRKRVDELSPAPLGIAATADHAFLHVSETNSLFVANYRIGRDAVLEHRQPFGYLHLSANSTDSGVGSLASDTDGRIYVVTQVGVQVLDPLGRCNLILSNPTSSVPTGIAFGGTDVDTLFVTSGERVYKRKLRSHGAQTYLPPVAVPKPGL